MFAAWLLFLIHRLEKRNPAGMSAGYGFVLSKWLGILYMFRLFINALALFYFFGLSIQQIYMPGVSLFMILLPFALLLWYCTQTTLQKRARFLELLFPWIAGLFVILIFFAVLGLEGKFHLPRVSGCRLNSAGQWISPAAVHHAAGVSPLLVPAVTENLWAKKSPRAQQGETCGEPEASAENAAGREPVPEELESGKEISPDSWWKKRKAFVWRAVAGVFNP